MTRNQMPPVRSPTSVADTIVLSYETVLSSEQRQAVSKKLEQLYPEFRALVVDGGGHVSLLSQDERLNRIEAKLDKLIDALAADCDDGDEDALRSLDDGSAVGQARDTNQPL